MNRFENASNLYNLWFLVGAFDAPILWESERPVLNSQELENYKSGLFEEGQCEWDSSSTFAQLSRF